MTKVQQPRPQKPVPQRTCVGCRQVNAKRSLVRVVRTPEGEVALDPTGRKNGRGAYVHSSRDCFEVAVRKGVLERALKATISSDARASLEEYLKSLPVESEADLAGK